MKCVSLSGNLIGITMMLFFLSQVRANETDDQIEAAYKKTHAYRTYLKDDGISIQSENGIVTLSGSVQNETHKQLAEHTAEALTGVRDVDNKLVTKDESPTDKSDAWTAAKIKGTLMFHRSVKGVGTEVDVKDGVATLRGEAQTQSQKDLATEYAKDIEGVTKVNNMMTVKGGEEKKNGEEKKTVGEKIDDASITAQAKMVLLGHRSTSALHTKVRTENGVVYLSGTAKNQAEKDLVTKLVSDIDGVDRVVNEMVIE